MTCVERDYEAGLWVPSYYGLRYTVARKHEGLSRKSEIDPIFRTATLSEAQDEARNRNSGTA